jgi:hypothetical protein
MDTSQVFVKTDKGHEEIDHRPLSRFQTSHRSDRR